MNQPRSFAQREDAGKKKVTKEVAISRRIERREIDGSKSGPKGVARRRHPVERVVPWVRLCEEQEVTADARYQGVEKREEMVAGARGVEWQIAVKRGQVRSMAEGMIKVLTRSLERVKAQVRARVEHPFPVLKSLFRHRKTPYRGLAKNPA
jgi:IS5 family transposase